jgi:hypothetical protein
MQAVRGGSGFYVQDTQSHNLRGIWRVPYLPQMIARQVEQRTGGHMSRASGCDRASAKRESWQIPGHRAWMGSARHGASDALPDAADDRGPDEVVHRGEWHRKRS